MTILEALVQLRDDIKTWCINNFNTKLNKNLGTTEGGKILITNTNGEIATEEMTTVRTNLEVYSKTEADQNFAPAYTYSSVTDDNYEAGVTELETGVLHFVYE